MWELASCEMGEQEKYLKEGWEPFAVSPSMVNGSNGQVFKTYIYFRRQAPQTLGREISNEERERLIRFGVIKGEVMGE